MAQSFEPIETDLGIIAGRDAFFLEDIQVNYPGNTITLVGVINGAHCSRNEEKHQWIGYSLVFAEVLGFRMVELDFSGIAGVSSFDRVIESNWLSEMRREDTARKVKQGHEHYLLMTYDDVFDVISRGFRLILEKEKVETGMTDG
jgi:hypothetical protein